MRTREEIEKDYPWRDKDGDIVGGTIVEERILEVLLDIRDLLVKSKKKI